MRRTRLALGLATLLLLPDAQALAGGDPAAATQFIVGFRGSAEDAAAAIAAAGGTMLEYNEAIGVARAAAHDDAFPAAVRVKPGVTGAARNHSVGVLRQDMPHRFAEELPSAADRAAAPRAPLESLFAAASQRSTGGVGTRPEEPLAPLQWNMAMIGATANGAHRLANGTRVTVGIIDSGIDGKHPDLRANFSRALSRNFTTDIPSLDGPCEYPGCVDPPDVDHDGHGTHVAGVVAARRNHFGIAGVAPRARLVNVRAGQDSGYFFAFETIAALTYAADIGLDVVNMSFYVDPWLYNCASAADYVSGSVTPEQIAEQAFTLQAVTDVLEYAHARGVVLVGAAGNGHVNLSLPTRTDEFSPAPGGGQLRTVTADCLDLPNEGPHVVSVSAVGPSTTKADYSNYGLGSVSIAAPGGWFRDLVGTDRYKTPGNLILSTYPLSAAIARGLVDADGNPVDGFSVKQCDRSGRRCGLFVYLQGTSMAAPHVTGVVALIVQRHGKSVRGGFELDPDEVGRILAETATDHACPDGGVEDYTDEERPPGYNAVCDGEPALNGLYGEGIVDAVAAVQ